MTVFPVNATLYSMCYFFRRRNLNANGKIPAPPTEKSHIYFYITAGANVFLSGIIFAHAEKVTHFQYIYFHFKVRKVWLHSSRYFSRDPWIDHPENYNKSFKTTNVPNDHLKTKSCKLNVKLDKIFIISCKHPRHIKTYIVSVFYYTFDGQLSAMWSFVQWWLKSKRDCVSSLC